MPNSKRFEEFSLVLKRNDRLPTLAAAVALAGLCACGGEWPDVGTHGVAITNGLPDPGHAAVGKLIIEVGGQSTPRICSGTAIGSHTVLTAAHCLQGAGKIVFQLGRVDATGASTYQGTANHVIRHPQFFSSERELRNDIAVLHVWPPLSATPVRLAQHPPQVGQQVTLVGYGLSGITANDHGVKRAATSSVAQLDAEKVGFDAPANIRGGFCLGDSGGPAFAVINGVEVQVGVHSYLFNPDGNPCVNAARAMRVDTYASWIRQAAAGDATIQSASLSASSDVTPPVVTIRSPATGSGVDTRIEIDADASDDMGLRNVLLSIDGVAVDRRTSPPYYFIAVVQPGSHVITVVGEDTSGNMGQAEVTVTSAAGAGGAGDGQGGCRLSAGEPPGSRPIFSLLLLLFGLVASPPFRRPRSRK